MKKNKNIYLTKRLLVRKAKSAGKSAARRAMENAGFLVKVENDWVVKEHEDGRKEKISFIGPPVTSNQIILD